MGAADLKVAAVLLAAGLSQRMGRRNKLLIEIGGEPLVRRTARVYLSAGAQVHAVLGHEAQEVRAALQGLHITFIINPDYLKGQQSSVRAGVDSLAPGFDAILIALADQAALTPGDILGLVKAFAASGRDRILIPYFHGDRGNPVLIPAGIAAEMRRAGQNTAFRKFIDDNPHLTQRYAADHGRFTLDIDTPDDLASFETRYLDK